MSLELKGKTACEGIVIDQAFIYSKYENEIEKRELALESIEEEIRRFKEAIEKSKNDLKFLKKSLEGKVRKSELEILVSHIVMLEDPMFINEIEKTILKELVNAEWAVKKISDKYCALFERLQDPKYSQRKSDVKDVSGRVISNLESHNLLKNEVKGKILVAKEILPSELLKIVAENIEIKGMILEYGGETSHVAILAKSLEIPTLLGVSGIEDIRNEYPLILDARKDYEKVILQPNQFEKERYEELIGELQKEKKIIEATTKLPSITKDGSYISLKINVSGVLDVYDIEKKNPDGIGLLRTELIYMEARELPDEETQVREYEEILCRFDRDKEIIIRTLDIGADKNLPYYTMPEEENPFLGVRGIRQSLKNPDMLKKQLRAILRVAYGRNVKIMYPMVTVLKEVLEAKKMLAECQKELREEGKNYKEVIEQGIMVEVPSAVFMADQLAKEVDFFSIGTNDLTQYILATDRLSEDLSDLYDSYEPAVLRAINLVVEAGERFGKKVSICGEMAGDNLAAVAFLSMGIRDLSMVKSSIPRIRNLVRNLDIGEIAPLKEKVLTAKDGKEVKKIIKEYLV